MLTHAKSAPYGSTRVDAASVPSASEMPQPLPISSMRRQSASFWFQLANLESARQPARCCGPSGCSVLSIPCFEVRRLPQARLAARDPVRDPVDHRLERHPGRTEKAIRGGGINEPGSLAL